MSLKPSVGASSLGIGSEPSVVEVLQPSSSSGAILVGNFSSPDRVGLVSSSKVAELNDSVVVIPLVCIFLKGASVAGGLVTGNLVRSMVVSSFVT